MIRIGDRVRHVTGGAIWTATALTVRNDCNLEFEIVCCQCDAAAEVFGPTGAAYCGPCAPEASTPCRVDPAALVSCICGESLDSAPSKGIWTVGGIACEYRDCLHCHSTRAYGPVDVLRGRRVHLYNDPETSEISGEWDSFLDSLTDDPPCAASELRRGGVVLAKAWADVTGKILGWQVMPPQKETPCAI